MVLVPDARLLEGRLKALCIRPGVLAPAHPAALAHVEQDADVRRGECPEEVLERPAVDADCAQPSDVTTSFPADSVWLPPAGEKSRS